MSACVNSNNQPFIDTCWHEKYCTKSYMCFCVWPRCVFFWKGNILLPLIQAFLILIFIIIIKWLSWSLLAWLDPEQRFPSSNNPHFLLANLGIKGHDVICHNQGVGDRWHHEKYCILHNIEVPGALGNIVSFKGIIGILEAVKSTI